MFTKKRNLGFGHLLLLLLGHLHGDLLLLDEEGANDAVANAAGALAAAVDAGDSLPAVGQTAELAGAGVGDAAELQLAIATLGDRTMLLGVEIHKTTARSLDTKG